MASPFDAGRCTPISISLAMLAPDNKRQVALGITRGCNPDDTAFWILHFVLRDKVDGGFQDRVVLDVRVNSLDNPLAEKLAREGLKRAQLDYLLGPVTAAAKRADPGAASHPRVAERLQGLLKAS